MTETQATATKPKRGNLGVTPTRKRRGDAMTRFDRLPPDLRRWIAQAALPWSPTSCLKIWRRVMADGVTAEEACRHLDAIEDRRLAALRAFPR